MADRVGQRLGNYRLTRLLGRVLPSDMVDKSLSPRQTSFRLIFVSGQSG
jgi:hypothetical protein